MVPGFMVLLDHYGTWFDILEMTPTRRKGSADLRSWELFWGPGAGGRKMGHAEPLAHTPGVQPLAHHPGPCSDAVTVRSQVDSPAHTAHPQTSPAHPPHSASGTLTGVEPHGSSAHEQHPPSRRTTPEDRTDGPQDGDMAVVGLTTFVRRVSAHILRWCRLLREAVT